MTTAAVTDTTAQAVTYSVLFGGVLLGSVLPVIPTGVLVSGAAAIAIHSDHPLSILLVVAVAAVAALIGDMVTFALCAGGGDRPLAWLRRRTNPVRLADARDRMDEHSVSVLVLSRLAPAGRLPVLIAAVLVGMSWRWYLAGDAVAVLAWSATYSAIGIVGGSFFDQPWQGVLLAVALVLLVSAAPPIMRRLRRRPAATQSNPAADGADRTRS